MSSSQDISRLYYNVLLNDLKLYQIPDEAVRISIENMAAIYTSDTANLNSNRAIVADYNDAAHRCAYLHKYAAFHTAMVRDVILEAIESNYDYFRNVFFSEQCFKICSLGGGPGSDVIGALAAFHCVFSYFNASATVVDYMVNWSYSFESIIKELSFGNYGSFGAQVGSVPWCYFGANLLKTLTPEVNEALSSASLVTMVKFASAAACQATERMMENIFSAMKPGAIVLFIDNSGGGYHEIFKKAAKKCNFFTVFGPVMHKNYTNLITKMRMFGKVSCCKSTIAVHMLQKPLYSFPAFLGLNIGYSHQRAFNESYTGLASPPTPMVFNADFVKDECIDSPEFVSSTELPLSPNNLPMPSSIATPLHENMINTPLNNRSKRRVLYTPNTQSRHKKRNPNGCLPFRHLRNRVAERINKFKAQARRMIKKKKNEKAHPIFKI